MQRREITRIDIDIEVHRAIEARRATFNQDHNDILREVFGLGTKAHDGPAASHETAATETPRHVRIAGRAGSGARSLAPPTANRRTGRFTIELLGERSEAHSLRDAYVLSLQLLSARYPGFLDGLSRKETRARRIVARRKEDLYKNNPRLADDFAMRLSDGWWVDTNLSRPQCESRLETACEVAGLRFGKDLTVGPTEREVQG